MPVPRDDPAALSAAVGADTAAVMLEPIQGESGVHPIADDFPRLQRWRAHLLAMPEVARCVEEARPYRAFFPLGAPDRD